jgi:histidyl-tRNA synthetase
MTNLSTQPYKGTRDYYPEDKAIQEYIFNIWKKVVGQYGYREYGTPILEPLEVYTAKSGEELAGEQTYRFTDRGDRTVAIRPEMTPSVSRLVASRRQELAYPARLFSIANFMRYERPQKGREREFWQLNVDLFGAEGLAADAETIQLGDRLLKAFGADSSQYVIKVNDRRLINEVISGYLGVDSSKANSVVKLLDRINKLSPEEFRAQAGDIMGNSDEESIARLLELTEVKAVGDLPSSVKDSTSALYLQSLIAMLNSMGVDSVEFDFTLVRGLDYYTGIVFEVFDKNPENSRSLFGGGRYDGLVGMFGAEPISAVGFAPGYTTTELFLKNWSLLPELNPQSDAYIVSLGDNSIEAFKLADQLRESGISIEVDVTERKLDKQIKAADKKGIAYVIFVGDDEVSTGVYKVKNIKSGDDFTASLEDLRSRLVQ